MQFYPFQKRLSVGTRGTCVWTVRQVDTQAYWSLAHFTRGHGLRIEHMEEIILIIAQSLGLMLLSLRPDRRAQCRTSACELRARGCTRAKTAPIVAISISLVGIPRFLLVYTVSGRRTADRLRTTILVSREPSYMVRCPEHYPSLGK